ncbi:TRAM domain-containing protein [Haloferax mediterranei ATCC 33500]|uniref:Ribosomal RNA large subunit methyltransferase E n=1 Tax=Haloferax mediterranei (strain ATCC 33500 / DSM 1411 / JCM 8866 / NBRC 14739 / NCIMB 2177 / R-4) TaxID=523841 RepID=I3R109_HALMT|nr:23S rRNA (uridine(2552)-2'-O)-methyltransferase [Haloferax mediterranei]AFK17919.1 ribosomal RNA large subunit methyltransferase J [Haloferax mediterranei ATCC 33500]AHZ22657.1 23S rRNA methyltransferase [Haloferax mediterranei ATCC 33500]EMA02806.1 23S rRNA methyltransferase J [Haloferax mediterranei ATCC 33500]MDX5988010.1 23S rRNA (uridine(2552)-2'-O)-methyltransferase [Haloferax mediterranei ATCC 33500]QCQ74474.1 TRAM domain-containing protein [Haloferax mediterranei ATCC 33500]
MARKDHYYNKAKQEGYRARSAYKLKQLDEDAGLFGPGNTVVDLGAAPGGWLQVASEKVGDHGKVVGVDLQRIRDLDRHNIETIRGDMTEDETKEQLTDIIGEAGADAVVSDMAPNMTGEYSLDHARSIYLARQAFEVAQELLATGGDFAVKVFDGQDLADFRADMEPEFQYVRSIRPKASRDSSSEQYLVGKHFLTAPVRTGDELEVEIIDVGSEGDGIAKVEDFTVFVSDTETGDTPTVRITDVKPRFAFAERVDD